MIVLTSIKDRIVEMFWTIFYFLYFLFKGNPRWKCETIEPERKTNCCVNNSNISKNGNNQNHNYQKTNLNTSYQSSNTWKANSASVHSGYLSRMFSGACQFVQTGWMYVKRVARWSWHQICRLGRLVARFWRWLMSIFGQSVPTKTLPATPKPFSQQNSLCDSPNYNKVVFDPILDVEDDQIQNETQKTVPATNFQASDSESFYTQRVFAPNVEEETAPEEHFRELSIPPPAPPPPPPKPIRIGTSMDKDVAERKTPTKEFKEAKKGIPTLPADVIAELSGTQRMRQERGQSAQREMTQSCHPDMAEWKTQERRERAITPHSYRASSVGPTMRKLEQVVSRLEDTTDDEAQFVFRPKPNQNSDGYRIGRSVFSPVDEVEQMRDMINRQPTTYDSRPVTPACSMKSYGGETGYETSNGYQTYRSNPISHETPSSSCLYKPNNYEYNSNISPFQQSENEVRRRHRSVGPYTHESAGRTTPFHQSSVYSSMPFTSHTSRRSKTPTAFDRGTNFAYDRDSVTQGTVSNTVRQWPPISNASGAPVEKDSWFSNIIDDNDNNLITTMARRVVERKVEDNWKWKDESGKLVDEQNQRTWKGELDTVLRDGPNQGRHWSRTVEVLPTGDTRFQDVSRQYDKHFVVEFVHTQELYFHMTDLTTNSNFKPLTLSEIRRHPTIDRKIRVYADGAYDLFHYGHMEQLKQAKTSFPNIHLIVGVVTDEDCLQYKSGPTVMTHDERVKSVKCCSFVDEVIAFPPFYPTLAFANKHRIDLVAHDSIPYEINEDLSCIHDCYDPFKKADRFLETVRTPVISTTELVQRIVSRAEEYKLRNVKRGVISV